MIHCFNLCNMKQSLLNMHAMTVYHLFEQQILEFHRREVLDFRKQHNNKLFNQNSFKQALSSKGIDITSFLSWATINELRLLANVVKHAEGSSSDELQLINPSLFGVEPIEKDILANDNSYRVFKPLSGDDIYVKEADIERYCTALKLFWSELTNALLQLVQA